MKKEKGLKTLYALLATLIPILYVVRAKSRSEKFPTALRDKILRPVPVSAF